MLEAPARPVCPPVPLQDAIYACCKGLPAPALVEALKWMPDSELLRALVCLGGAIGALEPLSAIRPGICDKVFVFDKTVEVPPATQVNAAGEVVPSERKLIQICAPMGMSLVVDKLRALPANLTAALSGDLAFGRLAVMGFSEGFCSPGEPADGDDLGTFQNVEHVLLLPEAGFDLRARNFSTTSPALFQVHAKMWATC
jgi:hypothetical protein